LKAEPSAKLKVVSTVYSTAEMKEWRKADHWVAKWAKPSVE
jgi:hypothetical protein